MRVCLLTRYFEFKGTGVTRISGEIYHGLVKRGHSVHPISTKGTSLYSYFYYTLLEVPKKLPRKDIDVYHALATLESMWLPKNRSIATFLDLFTTTNPERTGAGMGYNKWKLLVGRNYFKFGSRLASKCRFVTCISEKTKEDVMEYLRVPEEKIRVIRLGISKRLNPTIKKDGVFRIGTLGQLDRRKRFDLLIRKFKESRFDGELVIAGQGMDGPMLKELAEGDKRIKFLGLVPDYELSDFYNSLDVFVFPTWIEGYGLPIVEAMACKKPVVVLSDAIIPQEVMFRCIIVENLDQVFGNQTYLDNLTQYIDYDSNYKFAKEHSWDKCVEEYIKLYEEVIG